MIEAGLGPAFFHAQSSPCNVLGDIGVRPVLPRCPDLPLGNPASRGLPRVSPVMIAKAGDLADQRVIQPGGSFGVL